MKNRIKSLTGHDGRWIGSLSRRRWLYPGDVLPLCALVDGGRVWPSGSPTELVSLFRSRRASCAVKASLGAACGLPWLLCGPTAHLHDPEAPICPVRATRSPRAGGNPKRDDPLIPLNEKTTTQEL